LLYNLAAKLHKIQQAFIWCV